MSIHQKNQRKKRKTQKPAIQSSKKRHRPPVGLSIAPVSTRGRLPKCKYCQSEINSQEWHTVKNSRHHDKEKVWHIIAHYHVSYFASLSNNEQDQLMKIVNACSDIDCDKKKELVDKSN